MHKLVTVAEKKNEAFLRQKTLPFNFHDFSSKEISELITMMRKVMKEANGIGLSANQIGHNFQVFVAQIPGSEGALKFYSIFNPAIESPSKEVSTQEEGCLSVPEVYGAVTRPSRIILRGEDRHGKKLKIKAWGLLARVFQHEVDHLHGHLFIDKAKNIHSIENRK